MQQLGQRTSKTLKRTLAMLLTLAMVVTSLALNPNSADAAKKKKVTVKKVQITNPATKTLVLKKGKTRTLKTKVTVKPNKKANRKVTFKTSNKKVATVNKKGVVKAVKNGKATITVTSALNKKRSAKLTVRVGTPVSKVKLNKSKLTVEVKKTATLKATVTPKKATVKGVAWKSNKKSVATVSKKGKVTGVSTGTAKITATATDGSGKKATCTVTVTPEQLGTPAPQPTMDPNKVTLMIEDFESYAVGHNWDKYTGKNSAGTMTVVQDPENPNNKLLEVDNIKNSEHGYDFAPILTKELPAGKTLNDYESVMFKVRVVTNMPDIRYKVAAAYFAFPNTINGDYQFCTTATTADSYYDEEYSKFHVDKKMAKAKPTGKNAEGEDTYDPTGEFNRFFPQNHDTTESDPGFKDADKDVNKTVGFKEMTLTFFPDFMFDQGKDKKGEDLTKLDKFDMVIGASYPGMEDVTHKWYIDEIRFVQKDDVTTEKPITKLSITPSNVKMYVNTNQTITITKEPLDATDTFEVTSSDPSVATVDIAGHLNALKVGKTTITATAKKNPAITATCEVTVEDPPIEEEIVLKPSEANTIFKDKSSTKNVTEEEGGGVMIVYGDIDGDGERDPSDAENAVEGKENPQYKSVTFDLGAEKDLTAYKEIELDMTLLPPISGSIHKFNVSPIIFGATDSYGSSGEVRAVVDYGIYQDVTYNENSRRIKQTFALQTGAMEKLKSVGYIMVGSNGPNTEKIILHSIKIIPLGGSQGDDPTPTPPVGEDFMDAYTISYPVVENFSSQPYKLGWSNWIMADSNYKALTDQEGFEAKDGYVSIPANEYDGIALPLDNRRGTEPRMFTVEATVRLKTGDASGQVGFSGSNTLAEPDWMQPTDPNFHPTSIYYPGSEMKQYGNEYYGEQRTLTGEWQTITEEITVPAGKFGETRLKGTSSNGFELKEVKIIPEGMEVGEDGINLDVKSYIDTYLSGDKTITKTDNGIEIRNTGQLIYQLPTALTAGKSIKLTITGSNLSAAGFRVFLCNSEGGSRQDGGIPVQSTLPSEQTLKANNDGAEYIVLKGPDGGTPNIESLDITGITIEYLD